MAFSVFDAAFARGRCKSIVALKEVGLVDLEKERLRRGIRRMTQETP